MDTYGEDRMMERTGVGRAKPTLVAAAMLAAFVLAAPVHANGQAPGGGAQAADTTGAGGAPDLAQLIASGAEDSELRVVVRRFRQDRAVLDRRYDVPLSPVLTERVRAFYHGWDARLDAFDPSTLNAAGQEEFGELRQAIQDGLDEVEDQERRRVAMEPLVPFARSLQLLQERRRDRLDVEAQDAAQTLEDVRKEVLRGTETLRSGGSAAFETVAPEIAADAREHLEDLRSVLNNWYNFYYGFDPLFTWWAQMPYQELTEALEEYGRALEEAWSLETGS